MKKFLGDNFWLILIVLVALYLRTVNLTANPIALNQDEAVNGYDAYSLGLTLRDHHGQFLPFSLQSFGDWVSPALTYFTIPFIKLLGLSVFSVRLPMAAAGTLLVPIMYIIIYRLTKEKALALLAAFLVATSGPLIHLSRFAIPPSIVPLVFSLFILTVIKKPSVYTALTAALSVYSYPTQKMLAPLILIIACLIFFGKKFRKYIIIWAIFLFLTAPVYISNFTNPVYNIRMKEVSILNSKEPQDKNPVNAFFTRYKEYLSYDFLFGKGDPDMMHQVPGTSLIEPALLIFYLLAIIAGVTQIMLKKKLLNINNKQFLLLLSILLITPIPSSITREHFHLSRTGGMLPLAFILIFTGVHIVYDNLRSRSLQRILLTTILIIAVIGLGKFYAIYFNRYPDAAKQPFQYGLAAVFGYLRQNENNFASVKIDEPAIVQPYIYYLFYNRYNPRLLNPSRMSRQIGKYVFSEVKDQEVLPASLLYRVCDQERCYYKILDSGKGMWLVKKI